METVGGHRCAVSCDWYCGVQAVSGRSGIHVGIDGTTWRNPRGFGRFTRELIEELARRDAGYRYTVVLDKTPDVPLPDNVEVVVAGDGDRPAGRLQMNKAASGIGCDLFFYPTVYSFFPMTSRVPKVVVIHDTIPERFPDLVFPTRLNRFLWATKMWLAKRQATRFITCSESSIGDLNEILGIPKDLIDPSTMAAVPVFRPIDDEGAIRAARARHGIPDGAKLLIYVGGFNRHKNVLRLIEAFPGIVDAVPDVRLAIVGRTTGERFWDNIEDLQASVRQNAVASERIVFTGEISDDELALLMNAADALVHPSLYEGFGFPPVEAMACRTPVLGSDASSVPEVVGDAGLLFDPTDPAAIKEQAIRLLTDDELRATLAARAPGQAAKFTWERAAETTEASFAKTLAMRGT